MSKLKLVKNMRFSNVFILLIIVLLSCTLLIFINYFTIKILSTSRAYVNGESHYSKSQKDASRHLITYLYTQEPKELLLYERELKVSQDDAGARIALQNGDDIATARQGFINGRNHPDDIDDMIWMFVNFEKVSFLAKAVKEWERADQLTLKLSLLAKEIDFKIKYNLVTIEAQKEFLKKISLINDQLSVSETTFSDTLGEGTRKIKALLFATNIFFILIIIWSVCLYYSIMVKRLIDSKKQIEIKNENLLTVNKELDRFVYSASHDLRSPIISLKGLIEITQSEDNIDQIRKYLELMHQSITIQDQFLTDILDYSKNKKNQIINETVSLEKIIDETISQLMHLKSADKIAIRKEIAIDVIKGDTLRIKIIIANLMSNAIKYADINKNKMYINIKTYTKEGFHTVEISDNGIGIKEDYKDKIFEMYFGTNKNKGSGLGLYIVKEAIENIKGNIIVTSQENIRSVFTVSFPVSNENLPLNYSI